MTSLYTLLFVDAPVTQRYLFVDGGNALVESLAFGVELRLSARALRLQRFEFFNDCEAVGFVAGLELGSPPVEVCCQADVVGLKSVLQAFQHHVVDGTVVDFLGRCRERHPERGKADGAEQCRRYTPGTIHGRAEQKLPRVALLLFLTGDRCGRAAGSESAVYESSRCAYTILTGACNGPLIWPVVMNSRHHRLGSCRHSFAALFTDAQKTRKQDQGERRAHGHATDDDRGESPV